MRQMRPTPRTTLAATRALLAPVALATLAVAAAASCRRERTTDAEPPAAAGAPAIPASHRTTTPLPEPRWTRGGTEQDTIFADPTSAVADADRIYVLDRGTGRVLALRAGDGRLLWTTSPPDSTAGPATAPAAPPTTHATTPTAIASVPGGGVAVADAAHGTIATFDRDGRLRHTTPFGQIGDVRALCALPDSAFLLRTSGAGGGLLRLSPTGVTQPVPLPWPDLAGQHSLTTQSWLASPPDSAPCAVALVLGRGFALYDGTRFDEPHPYVEPLPLPGVVATVIHRDSGTTVVRQTLSSERIAAQSIAAGGGYVAVAFDGASPDRSRLVDLYDARSGRYLASTRFSHRVRALATDGHDLFLLHTFRGRPALSAVPLPPAHDFDSTHALTPR